MNDRQYSALFKVRDLESRVDKLESASKSKTKDFWDKLGAASGLVSGILVALIGFYATNIFDSRSKETEKAEKERNTIAIELQTVEKFLPHLSSTNELEKQMAIEAVSFLGNPKLAAKMAKVVGGPGARAALTNIAISSPDTKSPIIYALTDLYKQFSDAVGKIVVECSLATGQLQRLQGTFFFITKDGYALTAAHLVGTGCVKPSISVSVGSPDGVAKRAELVKLDMELDLALIKLSEGSYRPVNIARDSVSVGEAITVIGFPLDGGPAVAAGTVSSTGPGGRLIVDAALSPGWSGSPIFNSHGEVTGVVTGGMGDVPAAVVVPIQFARPLAAMAGIQ